MDSREERESTTRVFRFCLYDVPNDATVSDELVTPTETTRLGCWLPFGVAYTAQLILLVGLWCLPRESRVVDAETVFIRYRTWLLPGFGLVSLIDEVFEEHSVVVLKSRGCYYMVTASEWGFPMLQDLRVERHGDDVLVWERDRVLRRLRPEDQKSWWGVSWGHRK